VLPTVLSSRHYSRFTVGRCCPLPWAIPYGGGPSAQSGGPSVHPIVEE